MSTPEAIVYCVTLVAIFGFLAFMVWCVTRD
jgi:hypothetical protein